MATNKNKQSDQPKRTSKISDQSIGQAFLSGFMWPLKAIWRGLVWLSHQFPFKQIGHGLRWFFNLKPIRFIGRLLGLRYIRDSWRELRTVTWPTFRESRRLTGAVIVFSVTFGLFIALVDFGLDKLFRQILLR